ncbi:MAG: hypothetical protein RR922_01710 [Clostridia bacterium]
MDFIKGTVIGMAIGTFLGFYNEDKIDEVLRYSKKRYKKMMKRYNYNLF